MPKFLVDLSLDGYETPEEEAAACEAFIGEQLDFSASSVRVKRLEGRFCGQMSDGFGEGLCDFSFHRLKPGAKGDKNSDYERVITSEGEIPAGTKVFFVNDIFEP